MPPLPENSPAVFRTRRVAGLLFRQRHQVYMRGKEKAVLPEQ